MEGMRRAIRITDGCVTYRGRRPGQGTVELTNGPFCVKYSVLYIYSVLHTGRQPGQGTLELTNLIE